MKKIIFIFTILILGLNAQAIEADDSIDELIKKKYNTETSALPKLPKTSPKSIESQNFIDSPVISVPETNNKNLHREEKKYSDISNIPTTPQKNNARTTKLGWGKKINVKFENQISDRSQKGKRVVFTSQSPINTRDITLPSGTKFYGTIVNSHSPQILGNGGLVAVKIEYVEYKGKTAYCEGNLVKVNHNVVLFNNIKGKNGYIKGMAKVIKPAKTFYGKSLNVSKKLWNSPIFIIAPVTYLPGAVFFVGDAMVSPFIAAFHKGERINIPKGSTAVIKIITPAYIEY